MHDGAGGHVGIGSLLVNENGKPDAGTPDAGAIAGDTHTRLERVYFEHTDFSGVVYHARYLDFLEHARSDYVRLLGVHHGELAERGLAFAVHRMEIGFRGAARIDDVLRVETDRGTLSGARLAFAQRIRHGDALILEATVCVVLVSPDGRPRRFPRDVIERLGVRTGVGTDTQRNG